MNRSKAKRQRKHQAHVERLGPNRGQREFDRFMLNIVLPARAWRRSPEGQLQMDRLAEKAASRM